MIYKYFIEFNGFRYYKADSGWSKTVNITQGKSYSAPNIEHILTSYGYGYDEFYREDPNGYKILQKRENNSLMGYSTFDSIITKDSTPIYTKYLLALKLNDKGNVEFIDYKVLHRNKQIDNIIT